ANGASWHTEYYQRFRDSYYYYVCWTSDTFWHSDQSDQKLA
ncbi:5260_t:CDS:1, partial [Entrophospora sp. SA101]